MNQPDTTVTGLRLCGEGQRPGATASLVIGGTGMLADATRWLALHYPQTLLVARRASGFAPDTETIVPLDLDWSLPDFAARIGEALETLPPLAKALVWLHDPARHLLPLWPFLKLADVVVVLGSMDGQPDIPDAAKGAVTVRLGSMPTPTGRRWLTDAEISAGAIASLEDRRSRIVGERLPVGSIR